MPNSTAQNEAITAAKNDAARIGQGAVDPKGSRPSLVESPVSGTAFQPSGGAACDLYLAIKTAASLQVDMGPTSATAIAIMPSQTAALSVITLDVPAGWFVKLTGTMANLTATSVRK